MSLINRIQNPAMEKLASLGSSVKSDDKGGADFSQQLMDVLKEVNDSQNKAAETGADFMTGRRSVDYHDLMIAMERASTAMNLTVAVRNKLLDAYQEISRIQV
jgi:flagellar hook-basal body complex protein FliE